MSTNLKLSQKETDAVLAALRLLQLSMEKGDPVHHMVVEEILTNSGEHDAATVEEIEAICDRIQFE